MTIKIKAAQPAVVRAERGQAAAVATLVAGAFQHLAVSGWLIADPVERAIVLPANLRIYVEYALEHGHIDVTADLAAAAVWLPRDSALPQPCDYDTRLAQVCGKHVERFRLLDDFFAAHHPQAPHHHLVLLATRGDRQRRGLGSALLRHHHRHLDRVGVAAYLEASSPGSRDLYLRHGYRVLPSGNGPPRLPAGGPPVWPMWRDPL